MRPESHDYIVVGAGSAGCVLADRLSADPDVQVLLLEAGPRDSSPWIHIPVGYYKSIANPAIGWGYETDPVPVARKIIQIPAMTSYVRREVLPGPDVNTDEEMLEYVRDYGSTIFHPTSTCRMGRDDMAVVDERLRARGLQSLRVADASVMPTVVSGNTNAACVMIGEKAAEMLLQDSR